VRLAGLEIGSVAALSLPKQLERKETRVSLVVQSRYMERIRADSKAFIDTAGLLGDKIVNISMGDPKAAGLGEGSTLVAGEKATFDSITADLAKAAQSIASVTKTVDGMVQDGRTEQLQRDLSRVASSLAAVMSRVERGPGLAHSLIFDPRYADDAAVLLEEARAVARKTNGAVERVDRVLAEVERGEGTLHALVYGQEGKRALSELSRAASDIDAVVRDVRDGRGVLHSLVYEENQGNFLHDLNRMSATLSRIVDDIDKGHGTLGGLVRDPTVYEDLKTTLGNVKRNVLLKAIIRFTMEKEGLRRVGEAPHVEEEATTTQNAK
jgi:phospholipid/cholesterol/gamma-HCH transport system substrate-binding protein